MIIKLISFFLRAKNELNEEVTRYLQDFPEEMIFHTSNLHLLDSVGQGKIMCEANKRTSETKILFELTVLYKHQATMLQFSHLYNRHSLYMFCCLTPCESCVDLVTLGTRL